MTKPMIEALESRRLFSDASSPFFLTGADVAQVIAQAAPVSLRSQAIVVVDRNGFVLGIYGQDPTNSPAAQYAISTATARARTAAAFESTQDAFSTRTARFIIQDHFPQPVTDTEGGPLYGVEFSNLAGADVLPAGTGSGLSGDPGGIPLFKDGQPVGGVGVAGDGHDIAPRSDLISLPDYSKSFDAQTPAFKSNPTGAVWNGTEEHDFDESVALAAAQNFMAPAPIQAGQILVGGLRFPFTIDAPSTTAHPDPTLAPGLTDVTGNPGGKRALRAFPSVGKTGPLIRGAHAFYPISSVGGFSGKLKNTNPAAQGRSLDPAHPELGFTQNFGLLNGLVHEGQQLTVGDIETIFANGIAQANAIRGAIRQPIGVPAKVHLVVTDLTGQVLGIFAMHDATNFSFDVAVQKARTAEYFSDDAHAFSSRGVGFMSQLFFPAGQDGSPPGPLYHLQDVLSTTPGDIGLTLPNGNPNPLANGITVFPGGLPLYKNGVLVGAVGISGDGVDQDDMIAFASTKGFEPPAGIRDDQLAESQIVPFIKAKVDALPAMGFVFPPNSFVPSLNNSFNFPQTTDGTTIIQQIDDRLSNGLYGVRLPYVKFPRNPEV